MNAKPEKLPSDRESNPRGKASGDEQKKELTPGILQEFLTFIKLRTLMREASPALATKEGLAQIELELASDKAQVKQGAIEKLDGLLRGRADAEKKVGGAGTVALVEHIKVPGARREKLLEVARAVDRDAALLESGELSDPKDLKVVELELTVLAQGLGVEADPQAMEESMSRIDYLRELVNAKRESGSGARVASPLEPYAGEFVPGTAGESLQIREVSDAKRGELERKLDQFKQRVNDELVRDKGAKLGKLTPDELLQRIEETTEWRRNKSHLVGRKPTNTESVAKTRNLLMLVEAQYEAELERKIVEGLKGKGVGEEYIRAGLGQALEAKRMSLNRTGYDFNKGVPRGKTPGEVITEETLERGKKMEEATKLPPRTANPARREAPATEADLRAGEFRSEAEAQAGLAELKRLQALSKELERKLGVKLNDPEFIESLLDSEEREKLMARAATAGLTNEETRELNGLLANIGRASAGGELGGRMTGVQLELLKLSKEAKKTGDYAKYMIKLQAYIDRVGLREASSDFQFAVVMRQAKDEFSAINDDAGGKFDLWQESQFLPGLATVDEETFFNLIPRVVTQSRMQYELEGKYANWLGMQVQGEGGKKVLSVASFYQMLQERTNAMRMLMAPINGNDSTIWQLWVEQVWGEGAKLDPSNMTVKLANGEVLTSVDVSYFSMDAASKVNTDNPENMTVKDFLQQSMWMSHYALKLWWFSGEWEQFVRDFPAERLPQANKRLLNIGAGFRDYGLDYGKFDVGYIELAKAGVLLQDFRTYKASDVIVANIRHVLYDTKLEARSADEAGVPVAKWQRGEEIGKGLFKGLAQSADVGAKYKPLVSLRSVDEIRLMGRLGEFETPESRWEWYRKQQTKIGRKGIPSAAEIATLRGRSFGSLVGNDEAWVIQAEGVDQFFADLRKQHRTLEDLELTQAELAPLMDEQTFLKTGERRQHGGESLDGFLRDFEYSSVLKYSEMRKGSDPLDYSNYEKLKKEATSLMVEVLNGSPAPEKIDELYVKMRSYMPPEQVIAWFEEFRRTQIKLRTFVSPWDKYKIAMTDKEEWKLKRDRGEFDKKDKSGKTIRPDEPPENIIGFNPGMFKIRDDRGDTWNVTGSDGFRVTRKKDEWGNHMWKTRGLPALTPAQIDVRNKLYVGNRWITPDVADKIMEDSFGTGRFLDTLYKRLGIDPDSKGARRLKRLSSKAVILLRQHPFLDDPVWAFWYILNGTWEYVTEAGKEITKEVAK